MPAPRAKAAQKYTTERLVSFIECLSFRFTAIPLLDSGSASTILERYESGSGAVKGGRGISGGNTANVSGGGASFPTYRASESGPERAARVK